MRAERVCRFHSASRRYYVQFTGPHDFLSVGFFEGAIRDSPRTTGPRRTIVNCCLVLDRNPFEDENEDENEDEDEGEGEK